MHTLLALLGMWSYSSHILLVFPSFPRGHIKSLLVYSKYLLKTKGERMWVNFAYWQNCVSFLKSRSIFMFLENSKKLSFFFIPSPLLSIWLWLGPVTLLLLHHRPPPQFHQPPPPSTNHTNLNEYWSFKQEELGLEWDEVRLDWENDIWIKSWRSRRVSFVDSLYLREEHSRFKE